MKFCKQKSIFIFFLVFFSFFSVWGSGKRDRLFDTVENGTEKEIKAVLRKNPEYANITRGKEKQTLLMSALEEDRELSVINILLKYDADPMKKDAQKRNSIMYAAKFSSSPEVLERLVKVNSLFNFSRKNKILKKDKNGKTTLDYAEENPSPEKMLSVLRKYVKEPKENNSQEQIPSETEENDLSEAPNQENSEKQQELQVENSKPQEGEKPEEQTATEQIPTSTIPSETEENNKTEIIAEPAGPIEPAVPVTSEIPEDSLSVEKQEKITISEPSEDSSRQSPVESTSIKQAEQEQKIQTYQKTSLFDYAEEKKDVPVPQKQQTLPKIIENPDQRDEKGRTKLMNVCLEGKIETAKDLLNSKADVNARDPDGWTALMFASRFSDSEELIDLLLKNGADPKIKNNYGVSALKLASTFSQNPKILKSLLSCYEIADTEARSSFISAITSENSVSVIEEFLKKGIPVNAFYEGKTPLMYAAEYCKDTKIIGCLLDNGAKINYRTDSNLTAFDFARKNKKLKRDSIYWSLKASGEKR